MSQGTFTIFQGTDGQWYFNLKSVGNQQRVFASEGYVAKAGAENGVKSVRANAPFDARYEKLTSTRGLPFFVLRAANNEIIGRSEEYSTVTNRDNAIAWVKANAPLASGP